MEKIEKNELEKLPYYSRLATRSFFLLKCKGWFWFSMRRSELPTDVAIHLTFGLLSQYKYNMVDPYGMRELAHLLTFLSMNASPEKILNSSRKLSQLDFVGYLQEMSVVNWDLWWGEWKIRVDELLENKEIDKRPKNLDEAYLSPKLKSLVNYAFACHSIVTWLSKSNKRI